MSTICADRSSSGTNRIGLDLPSKPKGAFYAFLHRGLRPLLRVIRREACCMKKVAVVTGNVFGESGEGFLRCSYATSREELIEALDRMETFIKSL